jgi:hypothetical protein
MNTAAIIRPRDFVADHSAVIHALRGYSAPSRKVSFEKGRYEIQNQYRPTYANAHDKAPDHDPAMGLHGGLVLRMVHPTNGALRKPDGAEYDDHQLNTIQTLSAIFVGEIAKDDHAHGGAREGQGIDCDLNISLMFRAPVYEGQAG